jgi:FkbM family methyltransferase
MTIVQIGCNDGKDHVLDFCLKNRDSIEEIHLIEPNPEAIEDCKQTYSDFKQAKFHNLAIVTNNLDSISLYVPQGKSWNGHASTFANHLTAHGHADFKTINVLATSLAEFFDSNKITKCDRLYIDAEGLDSNILLGLDIQKYRIARIEFEVLHTDGVNTKAQKHSSCVEGLTALGYRPTDAGQYNEAYEIC